MTHKKRLHPVRSSLTSADAVDVARAEGEGMIDHDGERVSIPMSPLSGLIGRWKRRVTSALSSLRRRSLRAVGLRPVQR